MRHELFRFKIPRLDVDAIIKRNKRHTSHARFETTPPPLPTNRFSCAELSELGDVALLSKGQFEKRSGYRFNRELAYRIPTSHTVFICAKELGELSSTTTSRPNYESWMASVGGILSPTQMQNMEAVSNRDRCSDYDTLETLRPPRYCRAAIVASSDVDQRFSFGRGDGLVDVKGCGISEGMTPLPNFNHNNGVYFLYEAFREYIKYRILKGISKTGAPFDVLPILGIVDLGIALEMPNLPPLPICTLIRAPHCRDPENCERPVLGSPMLKQKIVIEQFLQTRGLSSTMDGFSATTNDQGVLTLRHGHTLVKMTEQEVREFAASKGYKIPFQTDYVNVQLCDRRAWSDSSRTLVDLLHYRVLDDMKLRSVVLARNGKIGWGMDMENLPPHFNIKQIRGYLGDVEDVSGLLSPEQLEWATPWKGLMKTRKRLSLFTFKLTYDYMMGRTSGDDLKLKLDEYAEGCLDAIQASVDCERKSDG